MADKDNEEVKRGETERQCYPWVAEASLGADWKTMRKAAHVDFCACKSVQNPRDVTNKPGGADDQKSITTALMRRACSRFWRPRVQLSRLKAQFRKCGARAAASAAPSPRQRLAGMKGVIQRGQRHG